MFRVRVVQLESVVEPDSTGNDIWRESVALISVLQPILSLLAV